MKLWVGICLIALMIILFSAWLWIVKYVRNIRKTIVETFVDDLQNENIKEKWLN